MRISDWSSDVCSSDLDCTPVLFADTAAGVIGACHAGWRGALAGITDATIEAMEKLGARRDRIRAAVGPTIHQKSYEISDPFRATFLEADAGNAAFFAAGRQIGRASCRESVCQYV